MFHDFIKMVAAFVCRLLSATKIIGRENITDQGNTIYICNHQNMPDAMFAFCFLPLNTYFMAKEEYFTGSAFLRFFFPKLQVFPVNRQTADLKSIRYASNLLKNDKILCIFPQGTRCKHVRVLREEMHGGVSMLALRNKSRIIPMAYTAPPKFFHKNTLIVGKPVDMTEFQDVRLNNETIDRLTDRLTNAINGLLDEQL